MITLSDIVCTEAPPSWFCPGGHQPIALPQNSLAAAQWLSQRYPNRALPIPLLLGSQVETIALAVGALLSGHQLLVVPRGHQIPDWFHHLTALADAIETAPDFNAESGPSLDKPAQLGSWFIAGSGSSGGHKYVQVGADELAYAAMQQAQHLSLSAQDRWLCCLPLDHIGGLMSILRMAWVGGSMSLHQRFSAAAVASDLARCQGISVVPTMAWRLCHIPEFHAEHHPLALVGGAAASAELMRDLQNKGIRPLRCYGASETAAMVSCQSLEQIGEQHCGQAIGDMEMRIGPDHNLWLRGSQLATKRWSATGIEGLADGDGWFMTGDAAEIDAQGSLHILGRVDGAIHSGGLTIFPEKIEEIIAGNPWKAPCSVIPLSDDEWGQCLCCVVASEDQACVEHFQSWCHKQLAPEQRPKHLLFLSEFPQLRNGKINQLAIKHLLGDHLADTRPSSPRDDTQTP